MDKEIYDYYAGVINLVGEIMGIDGVNAAKIVKRSFFKKFLKKYSDTVLEEPAIRWAYEILYLDGALV